MTTRGRMAQIGQLGWLIRSPCDRDGRLGQWSRRGSRMRLPEPPECSLASDPFAVPLMACIVHRGIGHGEHDAGRATPVDRAATLPYGELARAAPVAVVGGALSGLISSSFYTLVPPGCRTKASRARRSQCPCCGGAWWARVPGSTRPALGPL